MKTKILFLMGLLMVPLVNASDIDLNATGIFTDKVLKLYEFGSPSLVLVPLYVTCPGAFPPWPQYPDVIEYQFDWDDGNVTNFSIAAGTINCNATLGIYGVGYYTRPGIYEVCFTADQNNISDEFNETNNQICGKMSVQSFNVQSAVDDQLYIGMGRGDDEAIISHFGDDELFYMGFQLFRTPWIHGIPVDFKKNRRVPLLPFIA